MRTSVLLALLLVGFAACRVDDPYYEGPSNASSDELNKSLVTTATTQPPTGKAIAHPVVSLETIATSEVTTNEAPATDKTVSTTPLILIFNPESRAIVQEAPNVVSPELSPAVQAPVPAYQESPPAEVTPDVDKAPVATPSTPTVDNQAPKTTEALGEVLSAPNQGLPQGSPYVDPRTAAYNSWLASLKFRGLGKTNPENIQADPALNSGGFPQGSPYNADPRGNPIFRGLGQTSNVNSPYPNPSSYNTNSYLAMLSGGNPLADPTQFNADQRSRGLENPNMYGFPGNPMIPNFPGSPIPPGFPGMGGNPMMKSLGFQNAGSDSVPPGFVPGKGDFNEMLKAFGSGSSGYHSPLSGAGSGKADSINEMFKSLAANSGKNRKLSKTAGGSDFGRMLKAFADSADSKPKKTEFNADNLDLTQMIKGLGAGNSQKASTAGMGRKEFKKMMKALGGRNSGSSSQTLASGPSVNRDQLWWDFLRAQNAHKNLGQFDATIAPGNGPSFLSFPGQGMGGFNPPMIGS